MSYSGLRAQASINSGGGAEGSSDFLADPVFCMAICEIVDTGSSIKRSGSIWVVPNNDHVTTRFLLAWDAKHMPTVNPLGSIVSFPKTFGICIAICSISLHSSSLQGANASTVAMDAELRWAAEQGAEIVMAEG